MNRRALRRLGKVAVVMFCVSHVAWAGLTLWWHRSVGQEVAIEEQRRQELQQRFDEAATAAGHNAEVVRRTPQWTLLPDADVTGTLHVLEVVGEAAGIEIGAVKPVSNGAAGKQGFKVSGHGTPTAICTFLAALEGHQRLMIVETGRISPGDEATLSFELGIATFHAAGAGQ